MKREEYNKCVAERLRGRKLSAPERRKAFCVSAKVCSKGISEEEAAQACETSLSQPKEPKPSARRPRVSRGAGGMRVVLLTTTDCKPCSAAREYLKDKIDKGLIQELNIQKSNEAADLVAKYGFQSVPKLLVLDDEGKPFSELQITDEEQTL